MNKELNLDLLNQPYFNCKDCEENYKTGGHCKVADRYQRLPRDKYSGALGLCRKIGGTE